jgi:hypothetical protein
MIKVLCDRCGREIDDVEVDADGIRIELQKGTKKQEGQYLYVYSADEDGEPNDLHFCLSCTQFILDSVAPDVERVDVPPAEGASEATEDKDGDK